MLVLTRKTNEAIQLGDACFVRILGISGDNVRLGIEAPREVNVRRTELRPHGRRSAPMVKTIHGLPAALVGDETPAA